MYGRKEPNSRSFIPGHQTMQRPLMKSQRSQSWSGYCPIYILRSSARRYLAWCPRWVPNSFLFDYRSVDPLLDMYLTCYILGRIYHRQGHLRWVLRCRDTNQQNRLVTQEWMTTRWLMITAQMKATCLCEWKENFRVKNQYHGAVDERSSRCHRVLAAWAPQIRFVKSKMVQSLESGLLPAGAAILHAAGNGQMSSILADCATCVHEDCQERLFQSPLAIQRLWGPLGTANPGSIYHEMQADRITMKPPYSCLQLG